MLRINCTETHQFLLSNEASPGNNILTISKSNAETNSTFSEDPIDSLQNDAAGNSSLRSADNEDD